VIRANTLGYGGKTLTKQIKVHTKGDSANNILLLNISANIDRIATITPNVVHLMGAPEETIEKVVTIVPSEKYDFSIINNPVPPLKNIDLLLKKSGAGGKGWELLVTNKRKGVGRYYEVIVLKTDSVFQPELTVRVFGNVQPKGAQPLMTP